MAKINQKTFKLALENSGGNQSIIAKKLQVTRGAITIFLSKNPKMRELCNMEAERIIDVAENVVNAAITNKASEDRLDTSKWKLLNSKRGKARGYGIKNEVEHSGKVFNVNITEVESAGSTSEPGDEQETERGVESPSG